MFIQFKANFSNSQNGFKEFSANSMFSIVSRLGAAVL